MYSNLKKIFFYSLLISSILSTSASAMDLVKDTCKSLGHHFINKESLKIIGASTATCIGFRALQNLMLAQISPLHYKKKDDVFENSSFKKPLKLAFKNTASGLVLGITTAVLARTPLASKQLTLPDLQKPAAIMIATATLALLLKGMWDYNSKDAFDWSKNETSLPFYDEEEEHKYMVVQSAKNATYCALGFMRTFFLPTCILLLRAKKQ